MAQNNDQIIMYKADALNKNIGPKLVSSFRPSLCLIEFQLLQNSVFDIRYHKTLMAIAELISLKLQSFANPL